MLAGKIGALLDLVQQPKIHLDSGTDGAAFAQLFVTYRPFQGA